MMDKIAPLFPAVIGAAAGGLPDPNHFSSIGWIVVSIAAVFSIVKLAMDLWKEHFRETPPPSQTYVTLAACEAHRVKLEKRIDDCEEGHSTGDARLDSDIRSLGAKIDAATASMSQEASRRASTVHQRMDSMDRKLARVEERSESTQAELRLLNQNLMSYLRGEARG